LLIRAIMDVMNLAVRKPMSLAEFLEWEERQELCHEFDGVEPVAITGGSVGPRDQSSESRHRSWRKAEGHSLPVLRQRSQDPGRQRPHPGILTAWSSAPLWTGPQSLSATPS
jgi:hypothetical protein